MISVDGTLTAYENLLLFAKLYDIPSKEAKQRVKQSLEFMNLEDSAHKATKTNFPAPAGTTYFWKRGVCAFAMSIVEGVSFIPAHPFF